MKNFAKRALAYLLVLSMLATSVMFGSIETAATPEEGRPVIAFGTPTIVPSTSEYLYYEFTPEESGSYHFYSEGSIDAKLCVFEDSENGNYIGEDDDSGEANNFYLVCSLTAGTKYLLRFYSYSGDGAGNYTVFVEKAVGINSIVIDPLTFLEGTCGHYQGFYPEETGNYEQFYCYDWYNRISYTVTMDNGDTVQGNSQNFFYNGISYYLDFKDDQNYYNQWLGGNTYVGGVYVNGYSTTVSIEIMESPIESIEVKPMSIIEGTCGYYESFWAEEGEYFESYYLYEWWNALEYTVTMTNGDIVECSGTFFEYDGIEFNVSHSNVQGYYNLWSEGNTYTESIYINGCIAPVSIEITETPVERVEVKPLTLLENANGQYVKDYNSDEYFVYTNWDDKIDYTVYFKDGTSVECHGDVVEYNGKKYSIATTDSQSGYDNRWLKGNSYTETVSVMGVSAEITISITDQLVTSLTVDPISFADGIRGYYREDYNDPSNSFYYQDWYNFGVNYTATLFDGTVVTGNTKYNRGISYQGRYYYFSYFDDQSYENQWGVGEHKGTLMVGSASAEVIVEITPFPYTDLEIVAVDTIYKDDFLYITEDGNPIYATPGFTFKLTDLEGNVIKAYSKLWSLTDITVFESQYSIPWTVDGNNDLTIQIGPLDATAVVPMKDSRNYEYTEQNGGIVITDCNLWDETLEIPSKIDGKPVIGITGLGRAIESAKTVIIPDSVTFIGESTFKATIRNYTCYYPVLENLVVGTGVSNLNYYMFSDAIYLQSIDVSEGNPYFSSFDGNVYNAAGDTLLIYILSKGNVYTVPAHVTNIDVLNNKYYDGVKVEIEDGSESFKTVDGVTYSIDMTKVISCSQEKTGTYIMPDTVTEIADFAFEKSALKSVTVSPNVTSISYGAFMGNESLESIELPTGLVSIEKSAFDRCYGLSKADIPSSVTNIGMNAFYYTALTEVTIPEGVETVESAAFAHSNINTLNISNGVKYIGEDAFQNNAINNLTLPDSIISVGDFAFYNSGISTLSLNSNLTSIGSSAFAYTNITSINFPASLESIGNGAFSGTLLTSVDIPSTVTSLGSSVFSNCENLTEYTLSTSITYIPNGTFQGTGIKDLAIPSHVTAIGSNAFARTKITEANIPDNVEYIGSYIFDSCYNLTSFSLPSHITTIPAGAFCNTAISELVVPDHITVIETAAFAWSRIETLRIENENIVIGPNAFSNCPLEDIYLGNGIKKIDQGTFSGISAESITLPESVTEIAYGAFSGSYNLLNIDIPETVVSVGNRAFVGTAWERQAGEPAYLEHVLYSYSGSDKKLEIKDGTTVIADCAFEYAYLLEEVVLPEGLKTIGKLSFYGCDAIETIDIPASVNRIDECAFAMCNVLKEINVDPANPYFTSVDGVLFNKDMTELIWCPMRMENEYTVPASVEKIKAYAFGGSFLTTVVIDNDDIVLESGSLDRIRTGWDQDIENIITVICNEGSAAHEYAVSHGMEYIANAIVLNGWVNEDGNWAYYQNNTKLTNTWMKDSNGWCYLGADGYIVYNKWVRDSNGWCFVGPNGYMMYNKWIKDSAGWCYVGAAGYMEYNKWIKDSTGWCYVGATGYMEYNKWIRDSLGWCHVGATGYMEYNKWIRDSSGWCYVGATGYMEYNKWIRDSSGWCYVGASGYMEYNKWIRDSIGWCYVGASGYMEYNKWIRDSYGWCYVGSSGYMITNNWVSSGGYWYYMDNSGYMVTGRRYIGGRYYTFNSGGVWIG